MNQVTTVIVGALLVGVIAVVILAGYTSASAAKLPEQHEMVQMFISGSIIGAVLLWLATSGFLHGFELLNMISSDVKSTIKEIGLKGGEEAAAAAAAAAATTEVINKVASGSPATPDAPPQAVAQMVGGFLKSMGFDTPALKELTVGMPTF
jgi:hypothetical protein